MGDLPSIAAWSFLPSYDLGVTCFRKCNNIRKKTLYIFRANILVLLYQCWKVPFNFILWIKPIGTFVKYCKEVNILLGTYKKKKNLARKPSILGLSCPINVADCLTKESNASISSLSTVAIRNMIHTSMPWRVCPFLLETYMHMESFHSLPGEWEWESPAFRWITSKRAVAGGKREIEETCKTQGFDDLHCQWMW